MTVRPLYDRLLVRRTEEQKTTDSGIIIPDSAAEKPVQGEVVAIGSGKKTDNGKTIALDVAVGDNILFEKFAGNEVNVNGEQLLVMRESDVIAIIE